MFDVSGCYKSVTCHSSVVDASPPRQTHSKKKKHFPYWKWFVFKYVKMLFPPLFFYTLRNCVTALHAVKPTFTHARRQQWAHMHGAVGSPSHNTGGTVRLCSRTLHSSWPVESQNQSGNLLIAQFSSHGCPFSPSLKHVNILHRIKV